MKERKETLKKIADTLIQHEIERSQSNQTLRNSKNQNQMTHKNNYPWGIIIGMGVAIAVLLGVIVYLLVRKKGSRKNS